MAVVVQSELRALAANDEIIAPRPIAGAGGASKRNRLATLKRGDPNEAPAVDDSIRNP